MRLGTVLLAAAVGHAAAMMAPPSAVVNLTLSPAEAWTPAVNAILAAHPWEHSFGPVFASHNASLFDHVEEGKLQMLLEAARTHLPETAAAIGAIADAISAHPRGQYVSAQYLAGWLWFHELAHTELAKSAQPKACCAVLLAPGPGDEAAAVLSPVAHARNMDQSPAQVRNLTMRLTVVGDNAGPPIEVTDWYWITSGFMTAAVPGVASVQENWRFATVPSAGVFSAAARGVLPQVLLFRRAFAAAAATPLPPNVTRFDVFAAVVANTELAAPMYAAAAGPGPAEGVIITRDPKGPAEPVEGHGLVRLADAPPLAASGARALVQTNYDRWLPDPPSDPRRTAALAVLRSLPAPIAWTLAGASAAVNQRPVLNNETAYTALMCPRASAGCASLAGANMASFVRQQQAC